MSILVAGWDQKGEEKLEDSDALQTRRLGRNPGQAGIGQRNYPGKETWERMFDLPVEAFKQN